jgi:nickel/cobalt transporter (NiCoT) family protein
MTSRARLTADERTRVLAMAAVIIALHVIGFFILLVLVAPHRYLLGKTGVFGVGLGITAYTLGLRHAFDADHISAIDNTTRKLMADGRRPLGVGFFFSLGHSTIVFALAFLFAIGFRALSGQVETTGSTFHGVTDLIGTGISGGFLYLIAVLNVTVLVGIAGAVRRLRRGRLDERELEEHLACRGLMNRIYRRFTGAVSSSWQMYPLGLLFGLGFDTATEVALLFLAAGATSSGLPFEAILCLPILFAAGMSLLDTIDGSFMNFAYGWAFSQPVRKVYYNLIITALSVTVALVVGTTELLGLAADRLNLKGRFWGWISGIDINTLGYVIVGLFVLTWVAALLIWRFGRIERRWTFPGGDPAPDPGT